MMYSDLDLHKFIVSYVYRRLFLYRYICKNVTLPRTNYSIIIIIIAIIVFDERALLC